MSGLLSFSPFVEQRLNYKGLFYTPKLLSIERSHPSIHSQEQCPINEEHAANNCDLKMAILGSGLVAHQSTDRSTLFIGNDHINLVYEFILHQIVIQLMS